MRAPDPYSYSFVIFNYSITDFPLLDFPFLDSLVKFTKQMQLKKEVIVHLSAVYIAAT